MNTKTLVVTAIAIATLAGSALAQPPGGGGGGRGRGGGLGGQALTPQQREDIFKKADANGDGKLDQTELGAAITAQRAAQAAATTAAPEAAGTTIPQGGGGRGGAAGPMTPEQLDAQKTRYDVNKDGFVSLDEWKSPPAPARGGRRGGARGGGRGGAGGPPPG